MEKVIGIIEINELKKSFFLTMAERMSFAKELPVLAIWSIFDQSSMPSIELNLTECPSFYDMVCS